MNWPQIAVNFMQKDKKRRWIFGRFRSNRFASLTAPSLPLKRTLKEAEEEKKKFHSVAAAEPATSESNLQDSWLSSSPQSAIEYKKKESQEVSAINVLRNVLQPHQHQ